MIRFGHENPNEVESFIRDLLSDEEILFKRVALFLLKHFASSLPKLLAEVLVNEDFLNDDSMDSTWHEYAVLMRDQFTKLSAKDQEELLKLISAGPSKRYLEIGDLEDKHWKHRRFSLIKDDLPKREREEYERYVSDMGIFSDPEFVVLSSGVIVGLISPLNEQEMEKMTLGELIEFLKNWKPGENPLGPSVEGLGRQVTIFVKKNPEEVSRKARSFQDLDPTYVRAFLNGLKEGMVEGVHLDWRAILDLCAWVVEQEEHFMDAMQARIYGRDPNWRWSRRWSRGAVAELLDKAFHFGKSFSMEFEYRKKVFGILKSIVEDEDPNPETERPLGTWFDTALNTTRGKGLIALIQYALWLKRALQERGFEEGVFQHLPELKEFLNERLKLEVEQSLAVRSVYGAYLPALFYLDKDWAQNSLEEIFPSNPDRIDQWTAAWGVYILLHPLYLDRFSTFKDHYRRSIDLITSKNATDPKENDFVERVLRHLIFAYLHSLIDLDSEEDFLKTLYERSRPELRSYYTTLVGRILLRIEKPTLKNHMERLKSFWAWRLNEGLEEELESFFLWAHSDVFDSKWTIHNLKSVLEKNPKSQISRSLEHHLFQALDRLYDSHPHEVLFCLDLVFSRILPENTGGSYNMHKKELLRIFDSALRSDDIHQIKKVRGFINQLERYYDFPEFRNLLK